MSKSLETPATVEPNLPAQLAQLVPPRKGTPALNLDVNVATCEVLAALSGGTALPADAFKVLIERNRVLAQAPDGEILDSLTRQSTLLENLWLHFAARAAAETRADHASSLIKAALNCQRALGSVLATVHNLNEGKRNAGAIESA